MVLAFPVCFESLPLLFRPTEGFIPPPPNARGTGISQRPPQRHPVAFRKPWAARSEAGLQLWAPSPLLWALISSVGAACSLTSHLQCLSGGKFCSACLWLQRLSLLWAGTRLIMVLILLSCNLPAAPVFQFTGFCLFAWAALAKLKPPFWLRKHIDILPH